MKKSKLFAVVGACALIGAIGVGSTFAYLTAETDEVVNTFTVGSVNFDDELGNGIMEHEVARDENGDYTIPEDADWVTEVDYKDIIPGETVAKDPTVFITDDSVDCYLFVTVTNNEEKATINFDNENLGWKVFQATDKNGVTILYRTVAQDLASKQFTVFESVTFSEEVTAEDELGNIEVSAVAIQQKGFEDAKAAFAAFYGEEDDLED